LINTCDKSQTKKLIIIIYEFTVKGYNTCLQYGEVLDYISKVCSKQENFVKYYGFSSYN
jgi:hypothetical protein